MSQIDNILIQVRSRLQSDGIKLWLEPYYYEDIGPIESEIENLANIFSNKLGINVEHCKSALTELQDGAVTKLQAKQEFEKTGLATLKVKIVRPHGSSNFITIKCLLTDNAKQLQDKLSQQLQCNIMKIITAGRVLQLDITLKEQNISNNQQLMALVGIQQQDNDDNSSLHSRARQVREDTEMILKSHCHDFFRMEDQDGNAIHLPPNKRNAIIMALALYEKGRAALKKDEFAEALVLFLEADEQFSMCDSNILNTVDNYALLNLNIVWCYLCLKSFSQLPDAERRLYICEQSFQRSYGPNMNRVIALKGSSENEKTFIMRLHLLQGVLLFHQNRRNEAYEKLILAEDELKLLKVDENSFLQLLEMGYNTAESRIALRSCNGDIEQAISFITERRLKKKEARQINQEEDKINRKLRKYMKDDNWVNPKSLHTLISMGFQKDMAFIALNMSNNNIQSAIDLLHNNREQILTETHKYRNIDDDVVSKIVELGFDSEMTRVALEYALNNSDQAIDLLRKMQGGNFSFLLDAVSKTTDVDGCQETTSTATCTTNEPVPSTSTGAAALKNKIEDEIQAFKAYERFSEDISIEDDEYLDQPLLQEEGILIEYKRLLEQ